MKESSHVLAPCAPASVPAVESRGASGSRPRRFRFQQIDCPLCSADETRLLGVKSGSYYGKHCSEERARVVRCRRCDLIYANPMPLPRGADAAELYDESYTEMLYEHRTPDTRPRSYAELDSGDIDIVEGNRRLAVLEASLGGPGRLLDLGCGGGTLLCVARERGWRALGLEINESSARLARTLNAVEVYSGSIGDHGERWADGFDAVHFNQVLEHVPDPLGFLADIRRVLRPGGVFFCGVPNEDSLMNRVAQLYLRLRGSDFTQRLSPTFPPYHLIGFSPRTIRETLRRAGFQVQRVDHVNYGGIDWSAVGEGKLLKAGWSAVAALARPFGLGYGLDVYGRRAGLEPNGSRSSSRACSEARYE